MGPSPVFIFGQSANRDASCVCEPNSFISFDFGSPFLLFFFFFRCLSHSLSFLPFLRSLLRMFFLPYAYYVVAFFRLFLLFLLFLVFLYLVMYGHT